MMTTLDKYMTKSETEEEHDYKYYEQPHEENTQKEECNKKGWSYEATKNIAKWIKKDLTEAFGKTLKVSVTSKSYPRSIDVTIKKISKKHLMDYNEFKEYMICSSLFDEQNYDSYIAPYSNGKNNFRKYHVKEDIYERIGKIINKYNYDCSDPYTDYFDVNYYDYWSLDEDGVEVLD